VQPAQPFAGVEDQIVEREMPEPLLHRQRIGSVSDRHQRAAQGLRTLSLDHSGEAIELRAAIRRPKDRLRVR
jgi:hypothetical protein